MSEKEKLVICEGCMKAHVIPVGIQLLTCSCGLEIYCSEKNVDCPSCGFALIFKSGEVVVKKCKRCGQVLPTDSGTGKIIINPAQEEPTSVGTPVLVSAVPEEVKRDETERMCTVDDEPVKENDFEHELSRHSKDELILLVDALQAQRQDKDDQIGHLEKRIKELEKELQSQQPQIGKVQESYNEAIARAEKAERVVDELRKEIEKLKNQAMVGAQADSDKERITTLTESVAQKSSEIDSLRAELSALENVVDELKQAHEGLVCDKDEAFCQLHEKEEELNKVTGELGDYASALQDANDEVQRVQTEYSKLLDEAAELQKRVEDLTATRELSTDDIAELLLLRHRKTSLESDLNALKQAQGNLVKDLQELREKEAETNRQLDEKNVALTLNESRIENLEIQVLDLEKEKSELSAQWKKEKAILEETISRINREKISVETEVEETRSKLSQELLRHDGSADKILDLEAKIKDLNSQIELKDKSVIAQKNAILRAENLYAEAKVALSDLEEELEEALAKAEKDYHEASRQNAKLQVEINDLHDRVSQLGTEISGRNEKIKILQAEIDKQECVIRELKDTRDELQRLNTSLNSDSRSAEARVVKLEKDIRSKENEIDELRELLKKSSDETAIAQEQRVEAERKLILSEGQVQALKEAKEQALQESRRLSSELTTKQAMIDESRDQLQILKEEVSELTKKLSDSQIEKGLTLEEVSKLKSNIYALENEISNLRATIDDLRKRNSSLTARDSAVTEIQKSIDRERSQLAHLNAKFDADRDAFDQNLNLAKQRQRAELQLSFDARVQDAVAAVVAFEKGRLAQLERQLIAEAERLKVEKKDLQVSRQEIESAKSDLGKNKLNLEAVIEKEVISGVQAAENRSLKNANADVQNVVAHFAEIFKLDSNFKRIVYGGLVFILLLMVILVVK